MADMIATVAVCRANNSYNKPNPSNGNGNWSHCYRERRWIHVINVSVIS